MRSRGLAFLLRSGGARHPPRLNSPEGKVIGDEMDPISQIVPNLGEAPIRRLVSGFYQRVRQDDLIGPMYPAQDWEGAEKRLADFLVYRLGGAHTYLEQRGHPRLRARHFPFPIGSAARDRWLELMGQALQEAALPEAESSLLTQFFADVADAMRNRAD